MIYKYKQPERERQFSNEPNQIIYSGGINKVTDSKVTNKIESEQWRDIPNYEGIYQVSDIGRVRRVLKNNKFRSLKSQSDKNGYLIVGLWKKGGKRFRAHRLVALAFIGESNGLQVNHINGVKDDNRVCNLEYVTNRQNMLHGRALGLFPCRIGCDGPVKGEAHGMSKLTESQVKEIRNLHNQGHNYEILAKRFNVNPISISNICRRKNWKHI